VRISAQQVDPPGHRRTELRIIDRRRDVAPSVENAEFVLAIASREAVERRLELRRALDQEGDPHRGTPAQVA
jgi:hypothetical protein